MRLRSFGRQARIVALGIAAVLAAACATYRPEPIRPAIRAAQLEARSLQDPRLLQFIDAVARSTPTGRASAQAGTDFAAPKSWDLGTLTLAALYFHPSLTIARARLREAQAAGRTASEIQNPTLSFEDLSHSVASPAAWTVSPVIDFLIETAGKRARRTQEARALTRAALEDLTTASWQVRAGVRNGLLACWATEQRLSLDRQRLAYQTELTKLLERRFAVGEISALEVERARVDTSQLHLAVLSVEQQLVDARTGLARAIGIPVRALDPVRLSFTALRDARPPANESQLRSEALTGRSDVQSALAGYSAAEAALALEVARQYPNLTLGPGFSFDSVQNRYILLPQLNLPIFNHNQGPIAAAQARREVAAARFTALQLQVMDQVDGAMADYRAASATLGTADALLDQEQDRESRTDQSFRAGAIDRPALLAAQIERGIAAQAQLDALARQRSALGALEDALEHPLYFPQARWLASSSDPAQSTTRRR